jgi:hypothetical protein
LKLKKTLAVLLVLAMMFSLIAITATAVDFEGSGSAESPLKIDSVEKLLEFASRVTHNSEDAGLCAVLTADLEVEEQWTAIGAVTENAITSDSSTPYVGTFDGGGHTLTLHSSSGSMTAL